ncbi:MAG: hypothetical protein J4431_03425 [Candidatus Aenigmarchaeota archaeon]|nr:hypothetical protein [Candidatus Aenigmarchaeota archaeon]
MKRTFDKYSYFYSWLDSNVKRDGTLEEGARDYHRYVAAMEGSALRARFAGLSEELDMLKREFARPWSHAVSNPPKHVRNPNNELKK